VGSKKQGASGLAASEENSATPLTTTVEEALMVNDLTHQWWKTCVVMTKEQKDPQ
jgi:hypothetical protein